MNCPNCKLELEIIDTTFSNYDSPRAFKGQHTGDIYFCDKCETHYLDDFLTGKIDVWNY